MKAVALTHYLPVDNPDAFLDVELERPTPEGNDILVNVKAVAVNPVDVRRQRFWNQRWPKQQNEALRPISGTLSYLLDMVCLVMEGKALRLGVEAAAII